jgi:hypothetical protein
MGIFSFFSSNYRANDFIDKTPKQIIEEMKMDKLSGDILMDEEFKTLPEETQNAIQMMLDLKKGKIEIFEKCYNKRGARQSQVAPRPVQMAPRPMQMAPRQSQLLPRPAPKPATLAASARPPITHTGPFMPEQKGGKKRKRTNKKSKRVSKTRKHKKKH